MADFATINDVISLYRALTEEEQTKAEALIPAVSNRLRQYADNVGKDLDLLVAEDPVLADVAKSVTVDVVARNLQTPTTGAPMTQMSQSALGYSVSGTYLVPGGGIFIKNAELKLLGLIRQRYGTIDMWEAEHERNDFWN